MSTHQKRCPISGRFLPKQPRLVSAMLEEHSRNLRETRLCRTLDLATSALALAGIVAAYAAFAVVMLQIGGVK
jgi:hypothetical protein